MISAEEIKTLSEPMDNPHNISAINHLNGCTELHREAIHTLQTLLNQAAEALKPLANIADAYPDVPLPPDVLWVMPSSDNKKYWVLTVSHGHIAAKILAVAEPYIVGEGK